MILLSILQPSLRSVMLKSERISCHNNLKQISAAYALYPEDYDGWLCQGSGADRWMYELRDYLGLDFSGRRNYRTFDSKNTVLECPSTDYGDGNQFPIYGGYGYSPYMGVRDENYDRVGLRRKNFYDIPAPSETLVIGDGMNNFEGNTRYGLMYNPGSIEPHERMGLGSFVYTRHEGGLHVLWVDGHVDYHVWEIFKQGRGTNKNYYYNINK